MENLNAENIKRGLACCKGSYDCFTCDIYKRGCAGWREGLAKDALALINSQEQRIKELGEELDDAKRDTIPKLRWSLERANAMGVEADKTIEKLTAENERLRAENTDCRFGFSLLEDAFKRLEKINEQTEADTAKKIHFEIKRRCIEGGIYPAFVASVIEQVVKEITDETGE